MNQIDNNIALNARAHLSKLTTDPIIIYDSNGISFKICREASGALSLTTYSNITLATIAQLLATDPKLKNNTKLEEFNSQNQTDILAMLKRSTGITNAYQALTPNTELTLTNGFLWNSGANTPTTPLASDKYSVGITDTPPNTTRQIPEDIQEYRRELIAEYEANKAIKDAQKKEAEFQVFLNTPMGEKFLELKDAQEEADKALSNIFDTALTLQQKKNKLTSEEQEFYAFGLNALFKAYVDTPQNLATREEANTIFKEGVFSDPVLKLLVIAPQLRSEDIEAKRTQAQKAYENGTLPEGLYLAADNFWKLMQTVKDFDTASSKLYAARDTFSNRELTEDIKARIGGMFNLVMGSAKSTIGATYVVGSGGMGSVCGGGVLVYSGLEDLRAGADRVIKGSNASFERTSSSLLQAVFEMDKTKADARAEAISAVLGLPIGAAATYNAARSATTTSATIGYTAATAVQLEQIIPLPKTLVTGQQAHTPLEAGLRGITGEISTANDISFITEITAGTIGAKKAGQKGGEYLTEGRDYIILETNPHTKRTPLDEGATQTNSLPTRSNTTEHALNGTSYSIYKIATNYLLPSGLDAQGFTLSNAARPVLSFPLPEGLKDFNETQALSAAHMLSEGNMQQALLYGEEHALNQNALDPESAVYALLAAEAAEKPFHDGFANALQKAGFDIRTHGETLSPETAFSDLNTGHVILAEVDFATLDTRTVKPEQKRWVILEGETTDGRIAISDPLTENTYTITKTDATTLINTSTGAVTLKNTPIAPPQNGTHKTIITNQYPNTATPLHPEIRIAAIPHKAYGYENLPRVEVLGNPSVTGFHTLMQLVGDVGGTTQAFETPTHLHWTWEQFRNQQIPQETDQFQSAASQIASLKTFLPSVGLNVKTYPNDDSPSLNNIKITLEQGGQVLVNLSRNHLKLHEHNFDPEALTSAAFSNVLIAEDTKYDPENHHTLHNIVAVEEKDGQTFVITRSGTHTQPLAIPKDVFQRARIDDSTLHITPKEDGPSITRDIQNTINLTRPVYTQNPVDHNNTYGEHKIWERIQSLIIIIPQHATPEAQALGTHYKKLTEYENEIYSTYDAFDHDPVAQAKLLTTPERQQLITNLEVAYTKFTAKAGEQRVNRFFAANDIKMNILYTNLNRSPALKPYFKPMQEALSQLSPDDTILLTHTPGSSEFEIFDNRLTFYENVLTDVMNALSEKRFPQWYRDNFGLLDGSGNNPEPVDQN